MRSARLWLATCVESTTQKAWRAHYCPRHALNSLKMVRQKNGMLIVRPAKPKVAQKKTE